MAVCGTCLELTSESGSEVLPILHHQFWQCYCKVCLVHVVCMSQSLQWYSWAGSLSIFNKVSAKAKAAPILKLSSKQKRCAKATAAGVLTCKKNVDKVGINHASLLQTRQKQMWLKMTQAASCIMTQAAPFFPSAQAPIPAQTESPVANSGPWWTFQKGAGYCGAFKLQPNRQRLKGTLQTCLSSFFCSGACTCGWRVQWSKNRRIPHPCVYNGTLYWLTTSTSETDQKHTEEHSKPTLDSSKGTSLNPFFLVLLLPFAAEWTWVDELNTIAQTSFEWCPARPANLWDAMDLLASADRKDVQSPGSPETSHNLTCVSV